MKIKSLVILTILICLLVVLQQQPEATAVSAATAASAIPTYSYSATFGTLSEPYIVDSDHFNHPYGVALDSSANLWVAEWNGARAVKFDSSGVYQMTIGQTGIRVADESRGLFQSVVDVGIDGSGNVWLVDTETHRVVKHNAAGTFQSQIGVTWESGTDNSHFNNPRGVAFDNSDNLYVSDGSNHRIQVYDSSGAYLATLGETAVSGTDNAHFSHPRHIHIDNNTLYVADSSNHRVQIFDVSNPLAIGYMGTLGTTAAAGSDNSHFDYPIGMATNSSHVFVLDTNNRRVQIYDKLNSYNYTTTLTLPATDRYYADIAVGGLDSRIYIADNNMQVHVYSGNLNLIRTMGAAGVPYLTDDQHYNFPRGASATADGGLVFVEEYGHRLIKLANDGTQEWVVGTAGLTGSGDDQLYSPMGTAVATNGDIYLADAWNNRIQVFSATGIYQRTIGGNYGSGNNELNWPTDVAVAANGDVYVTDTNNARVQQFDSSGNYVRTLGTTGVTGSDNSHFNYPQGVAIDSSGNIYVADDGNCRIQIFNNNHIYLRTIAEGVCGSRFTRLWGPHNVNLDASGRVFVADTWNHRIQIFGNDGSYLNTLGGSWGTGTGQMIAPKGVAVTSSGVVYVADTENTRIQKFVPGTPGAWQVSPTGFGDSRNKQMPSLAVFNGHLYAGTWLDDNGTESSQVWRSSNGRDWTKVGEGFGNGAAHMIEFNGHLYLGTWNGNIWRSSDSSNWTQVVNDSLGHADNGIARFAVFNNTLYVGTWNGTTGAQIWRSSDGTTWTQFGTAGLGDAANGGAISSAEMGGYLYFGIYNDNGAQLWRTDGTTLTIVVSDSFGNSNNIAISALAVFDNMLYASLRNPTNGIEVWRSSNGTNWSQVGSGGLGDSHNGFNSALEPLNGSLYLMVNNDITGTQIWRTTDGTNWQRQGQPGFGDSSNSTFFDSATAVFNGSLFVGTANFSNAGKVWLVTQDIYLPAIIR